MSPRKGKPTETEKAASRARWKAMNKLTRLHPGEWSVLYDDERAKQGLPPNSPRIPKNWRDQ